MLQEEFRRLTDKPFTENEFEKIHYVYCYYPGIVTHADIALIWDIVTGIAWLLLTPFAKLRELLR